MMETKRPSIHRGQYPTFLLENKPALCSSHHTHYTHTRRCRLGNCCVTTAKLTHFIPFSPINPPSHIHLTRVIQPPPWPPLPHSNLTITIMNLFFYSHQLESPLVKILFSQPSASSHNSFNPSFRPESPPAPVRRVFPTRFSLCTEKSSANLSRSHP